VEPEEAYTTILLPFNEDEYVDYTNGTVNVILQSPSNKYKTTSHLFKYGINATHDWDDTNKQRNNPWLLGSSNLKAFYTLNCIVNSTENMLDKTRRDDSIVRLTEMGLFDSQHRLIAYSRFPTIEYRSDTQHVSFSLIIRNQPIMENKIGNKISFYDPPKWNGNTNTGGGSEGNTGNEEEEQGQDPDEDEDEDEERKEVESGRQSSGPEPVWQLNP
jgi:hypothetical protein